LAVGMPANGHHFEGRLVGHERPRRAANGHMGRAGCSLGAASFRARRAASVAEDQLCRAAALGIGDPAAAPSERPPSGANTAARPIVGCHEGGRGLNYARRQQYRGLSKATTAATAGVGAVVLALAAARAGAVFAAVVLLAVAFGLGLQARHWVSLARRSGVGARSEDEVRRALAPLEADGWRARHSLPWRGRGDIDWRRLHPASRSRSRRIDAHVR